MGLSVTASVTPPFIVPVVGPSSPLPPTVTPNKSSQPATAIPSAATSSNKRAALIKEFLILIHSFKAKCLVLAEKPRSITTVAFLFVWGIIAQ